MPHQEKPLPPGRRAGTNAGVKAAVLAPMSGVSDAPMCTLAHELGATLTFSEMVASEALVHGRRDMIRRAARRGAGQPFALQLAGHDPHWLAEGARVAEASGACLIDINMGCPARYVTGKLSGSALMRDLDHAAALIEATVKATSLPVTVKMRLGWDESAFSAPELARRAEAAGAKGLTVHARTRCQFFKGKADWARVAAVTQAVRLPVLVNGDIASPQDAERALALSGAAGVMTGRGACGAPWLPGRIATFLASGKDPGAPSLVTQGALLLRHVDAMLRHYGREPGLRNARKHIGWALEKSGHDPARLWRRRLLTLEEPRALLAGIAAFYTAAEETLQGAAA